MDEKTEALRDIFMDVSEEETVTESQEATPGSLAGVDEAGVLERLGEVVQRMADRYEFETELDDDALVTVVREFYEGSDDEAIAAEIGADTEQVKRARLDLHLLREADTDAPFDLCAFRRAVVEGDAATSDLADRFGVDTATAADYRRVVEAQTAARQVSHRFQSEFEDVLSDAGLSVRLTASLRQDGLDEATEDIDSLDSDADVSM